MRTDELRDLLRERGDQVRDTGAVARVDAVRDRVGHARRRRAAVVGGGAVATVAIALGAGAGVLGPQPDTPIAGPASGDYVRHGVTFRADALGERMLGAALGDRGEEEVTFEVEVPESGLRFTPVCFGPGGDDYEVVLEVNGRPVTGTTCSVQPPTDPGAEGTAFTDPSAGLADMGVSPGDTARVRALVEPRSDLVDPPGHQGLVVGAAVYEDSGRLVDPEASPVDLPPSLVYQGETWVLESSVGTGPGERSLVFDAGLADQEVLLLEAVEGLPVPASYEVLVDGEYVGGVKLERGDWAVDGLEGCSCDPWAIVDVLGPGTGHEAVLQVVDGSTDESWLALAQYVRAGRAETAAPDDPRAVTRVAGAEVPTTIEHEGRTWWLGRVHEGIRGNPRWTGWQESTEVPTLVVAVDGGGGASYVFRRNNDRIGRLDNTGVAGPMWSPVTVVDAGRGFQISVEVARGLRPGTHLAIVEYYPGD